MREFFNPKVNFAIRKADTKETIPYFPRRRLSTSQSGNRITVLVGHFDTPDMGEHLVISSSDSHFPQNAEIIVREHISQTKMLLLILGIIIGFGAFLVGLFFGVYFN